MFEYKAKVASQKVIYNFNELPIKFYNKKIHKRLDNQDWYEICTNYNLSSKFIRKYAYAIKWDVINDAIDLSVDILEDYFYDVVWFRTFILQDVPEEFILKHIDDWDEEDWNYIFTSQKLSIDTIKENLHRLEVRQWHTIFWNEQMDIDEMCASGLDLIVKLTQKEMGFDSRFS